MRLRGPATAALAAAALLTCGGAGSAAGPAGAAGSYLPPLPGALRVVRPFDPPRTPYGPGHRGVDLAGPQGATVRAPAAGTVRFAGAVGGRGVVVIAHPDGIRTEYEPVRPLVSAGATVAAGAPIAVLRGRHAGCPGSCLHWGARRGEAYLDPLTLLAPLGPVVLLP